MRRYRRKTDIAPVLLPDSWTGDDSTYRQSNTGRREALIEERRDVAGIASMRVTIISRDPLAAAGMRHMLSRVTPISLSTRYCIPQKINELSDQDVVIWIRMHHDGMPDLAGHVARLCRNTSTLKQLVISDALPVSFAPGPGPLSGVWMVRANESREMLYAMLREVIRAQRPNGPMLTKRLGRMQWRILLLRASGAATRAIAEVCGISVKTVSAHESAFRERLGVRGRLEYMWLLRSAALMQEAIPALCRDIRRLKRRKNE